MVTDPKALCSAQLDLAGVSGGYVEFVENPYEAASGAHAIALMTDWEIYKELDWCRIYDSMEKPSFVFDGRNLLDHRRLFDLGFNVYPLGAPPLVHF